MASSISGPREARWSWQCLLAILIALTPLLAAAPQLRPVSTLTAGAPGPARAAAPTRSPPVTEAVKITVDGQPLSAPGTVDDGVALAPAGALATALGGSVVETPPSATQIHLGGHVLVARAAQPTLDVDGEPQTLTVAPRLIQGQLYVPVRAIAAVMGYALDWLGQTATVAIRTQPEQPVRLASAAPAADQRPDTGPAPADAAVAAAASAAATAPAAAAPQAVIPYTPEDLQLMGRVIHGEADDQPLAARIGIAAVIVNRVRAPGFPKTIAGVIYAPGQFQAVGAPMFEAGPTPSDLQAALAALHGQDPTGGALYFYVPSLTDPTSWIFTRHTLVTLGVIRFAE